MAPSCYCYIMGLFWWGRCAQLSTVHQFRWSYFPFEIHARPSLFLQLIEEPRAIILKRQDLSLIFVLHYIFFFVRGCNVSRGGWFSLIHDSLPEGSLLFLCTVLISANLPTQIAHKDGVFHCSLSYISATIINGNVPGLHHHKHQS